MTAARPGDRVLLASRGYGYDFVFRGIYAAADPDKPPCLVYPAVRAGCRPGRRLVG